MKQLIERLRKSREYAELTQAALAKAIGVSLRTINNYEKEPSKLTIVVAQNIAHTCGVDEVWLLTGRGEMISSQETKDTKETEPEKNKTTPVSINDVIDKEHAEVIKKFRSKKEAKDLNIKLVALDWNSKSAFKKAANYIEALWDGVEALKEDLQDESLNQKGRMVGKKERKKA